VGGNNSTAVVAIILSMVCFATCCMQLRTRCGLAPIHTRPLGGQLQHISTDASMHAGR
jgi:hypothetical protein